MLVTLRLLKQCFYQTTEYGPAIFTVDIPLTSSGYTYSAAPSDLDFCQHILPDFMLDPVGSHNLKYWPNKTTLSYIMNHKLSMNGMKIYHQALYSLLLDSSHIDALIGHCDAFLSSNPGYSRENFETVTGRLAALAESDLNKEFFRNFILQLSRVHAGAALAFLLIHAVLHAKEAAESINAYLMTPVGKDLLTKSNIDALPIGIGDSMADKNSRRHFRNETARSSDTAYTFPSSYRYNDPIATFVGRRHYLSQIMRLLHDSSDFHHLFLFGISGIGKTELAKKYAATYSNYYHSIQMVHYKNSIKETICFQIPIANFDDSEARSNPADMDRIFSEKLEILKNLMDDHCLLIIDNMNNAADPHLHTLVGQGFPLLITTQVDFSDKGYQTMMVHALESSYENAQTNSLSALAKTLHRPAPAVNMSDFEEQGITLQFFQKIYGRELSDHDLLIIHNILKKFSGHTFITELLARQMKTSFLDAGSLSDLLENHGIFGTRSIEQVMHQSSHTPKAVYDYISAIVSTEDLSSEEMYVLKNLVIMPADGIAIRMFGQLCEPSSYETIWNLANRSLLIIQRNDADGIISLHPLIRELIEHNLTCTPEDYVTLLRNLAEISKGSWSKPRKDLQVYHDVIVSVLSSIHVHSEETLLLSTDLLEFSVHYGHFEFVIGKCRKGYRYAIEHDYSPAVKGAFCRVAGNCLYSAGLVYRNESTLWFKRMAEEYAQIDCGKNIHMVYALKNLARASLNQAIRDFGLKVIPSAGSPCGFAIVPRFSYPEIMRESEEMLHEAFAFTDRALALLAELLADSFDEKDQNSYLSYKGDIHYIRACIMMYLNEQPDKMIHELDTAIHHCYVSENGLFLSLSITAAMTLKAKLLMFKQDYGECDRLLSQARRREEYFRGIDKNSHLIRIFLAQGDSAWLQKHPDIANKYYIQALDTINNFDYLDKGRYYEEAAEKAAFSRPGTDSSDFQLYVTSGL